MLNRPARTRCALRSRLPALRADDLTAQIEDRQLVVRGKQTDEQERVYLHRGIAARQFQRSFVLADGIEVSGATLDNGLLHIDLIRHVPEGNVQTIAISTPRSRPQTINATACAR